MLLKNKAFNVGKKFLNNGVKQLRRGSGSGISIKAGELNRISNNVKKENSFRLKKEDLQNLNKESLQKLRETVAHNARNARLSGELAASAVKKTAKRGLSKSGVMGKLANVKNKIGQEGKLIARKTGSTLNSLEREAQRGINKTKALDKLANVKDKIGQSGKLVAQKAHSLEREAKRGINRTKALDKLSNVKDRFGRLIGM